MSIPSGKTAVAIGPRAVFVKHRGSISDLMDAYGASYKVHYGSCAIESASLPLRFGLTDHRCRKSVLEGHIQHEAFGVSADTSTMK